ncbi:uncharacterized protein LOC121417567 [Lytechinus variegatus]|uniref:uncharacterized protein LOC121417567 n=1 Tax=Lytechinus variegatus TaxID=7654 RepID=UPI001BB0E243|nr:uncharacterized protein LOC121417567 [Lytechinus variegatus]
MDKEGSSRLGSRSNLTMTEMEEGAEGILVSGSSRKSPGRESVKITLEHGKEGTESERKVFVTERIHNAKETATSSKQSVEQESELARVNASSRIPQYYNDIKEKERDYYSELSDEYARDVFEESGFESTDKEHIGDVTEEGEVQLRNDVRTSSTKIKRCSSTRMSSDSCSALDQEDLLQIAYETYVSVSSEIKKFLVKVIADAKRYESSHPAGVESRLRPINSKLPRFLDEQREGIGRDDTSVSPARGRRGIQSSSSQRRSSKERQKRHHEATTKSTRGQGRQRSRSEGDTELRSSELTKLPSIKQKSFTSPKTYYEITKEEQKVRETAPSALDLIYRQFGAVKKMKAGRQYSEDDYKKLKDMLRAQQKRYIRYQINL